MILFLRHTQSKKHHQGIDYLRSKVQERYAILRLRFLLLSIKSNSVLCRKFRAATIQPIMADLSKERLAYRSPHRSSLLRPILPPFVGTTEKGWIFLFTCLTALAVRVEVVPSMDPSSCVMGVGRFVSRRCTPAMNRSDNGRNFIGAEKELRDCIEKWNKLNLSAELAHKEVKWRFSPPSALHQVGIWERLACSFKRILYTILGTHRFTDEVLDTTFCLAKNALNPRPLAPVSANPSDLGSITINLFKQPEFFPSLALTSSIIVSGTLVRSNTPMQVGHVGLRSSYLLWTVGLSGRRLPNSTSRLMYFGLLKKATLEVSIFSDWRTPIRIRQLARSLCRRTHVVRIARTPTRWACINPPNTSNIILPEDVIE